MNIFAPIIVLIIRLLVPLYIIKKPLTGALLSMFFDAIDVVILSALGAGDFNGFWIFDYHSLDKILDTYYLSIELFVSLKWSYKLTRNTSLWLFIYRIIGVILYEFTHLRIVLFIFPNLFENFFIFYLIYTKYKKPETLTKKSLFFWLLFLLGLKMPQEYILHFKEYQPWVYLQNKLGI